MTTNRDFEAITHDLHCPLCGKRYDNTSFRRCPRDGSPLRTADGEEIGWIGEVVQNRYLIKRFLGKGGMAHVYEAQHLASDRAVAVKVVDPRLAGQAQALDRFRREAQLLSRIAHPNVIAVEDFGTLPDGALFMVMELLRGQTLQQRLEVEELSVRDAFDVTAQVCEAVHAAHDSGVIHRDIKPGNIFVEQAKSDGKLSIKVLDFGISKLVDQGPTNLTKAGTVFGTPEYMSPQQAAGHPITPSSDIYSLGVLLHRLLLGQPPFADESYMAVLVKHMSEPATWPSDLATRRNVPDGARDVVLKALEKDPKQRYQTAAELGDAIASLAIARESSYSLVSGEVDTVRVPETTTAPISGALRTAGLHNATGRDEEIVTLAPDVYWVGRRTGGALECNTYLRVYRKGDTRLAVLIDPGPPRDAHVIGAKVAAVIDSVTNLDILFVNHQDPDVSANAKMFQKVNPDVHVVCSEDTWRLIRLMGLDPMRFSAVEHFRDSTMRMVTGHEAVFVNTPYCHFRGAVAYYDVSSRVLFTGDLFGGLSSSRHMLCTDMNWQGIDVFHQLYMPSGEAVRRAIATIRQLNPAPRLIAPQHGALIPEDAIEPLFEHLSQLPMGLDLESMGDARLRFAAALTHVLGVLRKIIGDTAVRTGLQRFLGDDTFPALLDVDDEMVVRNIRVDPASTAGSVIRSLTAAVPVEHMADWLEAIHQAQREQIVRIPGVPEPPLRSSRSGAS